MKFSQNDWIVVGSTLFVTLVAVLVFAFAMQPDPVDPPPPTEVPTAKVTPTAGQVVMSDSLPGGNTAGGAGGLAGPGGRAAGGPAGGGGPTLGGTAGGGGPTFAGAAGS